MRIVSAFLLLLSTFSVLIPQVRGIRTEGVAAERRLALVIGNAAYEDAPLTNPVNDAEDIARTLTQLGFDVTHKENLDQNNMKRAIREFGEKIRNGGVALFYFAGHGVQVNGSNYLIPIGAKIEKEEEVEYESVDAGLVMAQMENAHNRMNIVILDACRNNPFARSFRSANRGLAQMNAPSGTLIAYSTAPGSVASDGSDRNGLYTQELLKAMTTPDQAIEEVFKLVRSAVRGLSNGKQTPWESSSLIGDFYFVGSKRNNSIARMTKPIAPGAPNNIASVERASVNIGGVWRLATDPNTVFQITQKGKEFQGTVNGFLGLPYKSTMTGSVSAQNVTMKYFTEFQNGFKSNGKCDGIVTPDGKTMNLTCNDSSAGTFPAYYVRQ